MFGLSTIELIGFAQLFLMAMAVVGVAAHVASRSDTQSSGAGDMILGFVITLVSWVVLTVAVIAVIGVLVWGGLWIWEAVI